MTRCLAAFAVLLLALAPAARAQEGGVARAEALMAEGQFDLARTELRSVLQTNPADRSALAALVRLELAAERPQTAKALAEVALSQAPHDGRFVEARCQAVDALAARRPWSLVLGYDYERFDDKRITWREASGTIQRTTAAGPFLVRATLAERFGLRDGQFELEARPRLRSGTYLHIAYALALDHQLFPQHRVAVDVAQALGGGFEVSAGFRRLQFDVPAEIYRGALNKYAGNWVIAARVMLVPDRQGDESRTYQGSVRRHFGEEAASFAGVRYSQGFPRDEIRNVNDLEVLTGDTVAAEGGASLQRLVLTVTAGRSRQQRVAGAQLRQNIVAATLGVRF